MLTVPITTPYFNLRVLNLLIEHDGKVGPAGGALAVPNVSSLTALDTNLSPGETVSQMLGVISPWIDLCSPDPIIFSVSRQVLEMEMAYAAFCGIGNVILPCPKIHHSKIHGVGIAQYAHATQLALDVGSFIQVSITMPMMDNPHDVVEETKGSLTLQARSEQVGAMEDEPQPIQDTEHPEELLNIKPRKSVHVSSKHDYFGTWDAWNVIRTICKYNSRLFVGKNIIISTDFSRSIIASSLSFILSRKNPIGSALRSTGILRSKIPVCFLLSLSVPWQSSRDKLIIVDSPHDTTLPPSSLSLLPLAFGTPPYIDTSPANVF